VRVLHVVDLGFDAQLEHFNEDRIMLRLFCVTELLVDVVGTVAPLGGDVATAGLVGWLAFNALSLAASVAIRAMEPLVQTLDQAPEVLPVLDQDVDQRWSFDTSALDRRS
jgi:hypothetical protein